MKNTIIAASMLASDFSQLAQETQRAESAGSDWLHLDVMDGHFVDNISFGPAVVAAVKKCAQVPLDVHLMIDRPDHYFPRFAENADTITVHIEARHDVAKTLRAIRASGCSAGIAVKPSTPFETVEPYLDQVDLLLVMTVEPGFGGQSFMPAMLEKVEAAVDLRASRGLDFHIEVDGGINGETGKHCLISGANVLVAGTSLFSKSDMAAAVASLRRNY